jgi:hypothetical protein
VTPTAVDLRAEAVGLSRRIAEAIYDADVAGLSHRDAPAFLFCSRDTIERYTRLAVAARLTMERNIEHRLDWLMDLEGLVREIRTAHDELRAQLTTLFSLMCDYAGPDTDVCEPLRASLRQLADLVDFDHAGWFDPLPEPAA